MRFTKFKIDLNNYLDIQPILASNPWIRNLMIITGKGTGKSSSARNLMKKLILTPDEALRSINNDKIDRTQIVRCAWIRNTERSLNKAIMTFQAVFTEKEGFRVNNNGVFYKRDAKPVILFVNLNAPSNAADQNLKIRFIVYDEFNNFETENTKLIKTPDAIKDFNHIFTDIIQSISRPYDDDVPYLIMLANPRANPEDSDLYQLFQIRWNWSMCNRRTQQIYNKKSKLLAIWTGRFKIKEMEYSLGEMKNVGSDYPTYNSADKRVLWWKDVKKLLKTNLVNQWGFTYYACDFSVYQFENKEGEYWLYVKEERNYDDNKQVKIWECWKWIDKQRTNQLWTERGHWKLIKNFYKMSWIFYSSTFAKEIISELSVKLIAKIPTIYKT